MDHFTLASLANLCRLRPHIWIRGTSSDNKEWQDCLSQADRQARRHERWSWLPEAPWNQQEAHYYRGQALCRNSCCSWGDSLRGKRWRRRISKTDCFAWRMRCETYLRSQSKRLDRHLRWEMAESVFWCIQQCLQQRLRGIAELISCVVLFKCVMHWSVRETYASLQGWKKGVPPWLMKWSGEAEIVRDTSQGVMHNDNVELMGAAMEMVAEL